MKPHCLPGSKIHKNDVPDMSPGARRFKKRLVLVTMFFGSTLVLFAYFGTFGSAVPYSQYPTSNAPAYQNDSLSITLSGYGTFQGTKVLTSLKKTTTFQSPIDAWLGVEYSTQPVGKDRFTAVEEPEPFEGTKDASLFGPACWQNIYSSLQQSEACLTVNVFRPSGIPLSQELPIFVWVHGGSFVSGSHRSFDGALFVDKSTQPLMVITVQYRLGALGTLPAKFMEDNGLLNLGMRDQKVMLQFLQKHASSFGGDASKITLGGQSAGGHAVGLHLFHDYNEDAGKPLFHQVILSSGSPTARAFPGVDYPTYQKHVKDFMDYVNCPTTPDSAALDCLRSADVDDIQFVSKALYDANNYNITWPWQPVSPGPLIEKRGSQSGEDGTFFKLPTLIASMTNEGTGFAPQDLRTNADYVAFWKTLTPDLSAEDFTDLQSLYPEAVYANNGSATFISSQYQRVSAAYGDYSYICPVQDTASRLSFAGAPVYKARFNTPNFTPTYLGVPHASDSAYFNGAPEAEYPEIADIYSAFWASFIVSGDPNTHSRAGSAKWETYDVAQGKMGRQLVVNRLSAGGPQMEDESVAIRMEQCRWWRDDARAKRLNK